MDGLLSAEDVAIVRAEQRGADFGVFVEAGTGDIEREEIERALTVVVNHWPSLSARIVDNGAALAVHHDPPTDVRDLQHVEDLSGRTVLASRGERLLRYRYDESRRVLQLLGHHVVLDADSLSALLADLDTVLAGHRLESSPEWPWEPTGNGRADRPVPYPAVPRPLRSTTPHTDRRGGTDWSKLRSAAGQKLPVESRDSLLAASTRPAPGEHAVRELSPELVERVARAAQASRVTSFGVYWAAAARLAGYEGDHAEHGVLATVVSTRLLSRTPFRSGNATTNLTVCLRRYGSGHQGVREAFDDFTATWRGRRPQPEGVASPLLVSLSVAPSSHGFEALGPVELGPYVVKFARHVQVQVKGDAVVLEAYAVPSGQRLLDEFASALTDVLDECLPSAPLRPIPILTARDSVAPLAPALAGPAPGALGRLLTAVPEALVRDVGVTSFDVLSVIDDLAQLHGIRVGVDTFYAWETAGDVQRVVAAAAGIKASEEHLHSTRQSSTESATGGKRTEGSSSILLPHLNDIFIDAYRRGDDDPYAVELAFVIDPALAGSPSRLAECARRCLARHEVWRAAARFGRDGVVLDLTAPVTLVREVVATTWDGVRDQRRLSVRNPSRLADIAVAQVAGELGLYLNVHHLLLDHTGLEVFLADLLGELRTEPASAPVTWSDLAAPLAAARSRAAEVWSRDPLPDDVLPIGPTGSVSGDHLHHRMPWVSRQRATLDLEASLRAVTTALGEFTGARRGVVGSVHHGRTVPGSDRLVGALARVLPCAYDLGDEAVLSASVRRLLTGQAALAGDTRGARANGAALPMPVVFQAIRCGGASGRTEHEGVIRRVEFEARTKFAVLLTLVAGPAGDVLEVTLSTDHYDGDDLSRLVNLLTRVAPGTRTLSLVGGVAR